MNRHPRAPNCLNIGTAGREESGNRKFTFMKKAISNDNLKFGHTYFRRLGLDAVSSTGKLIVVILGGMER